MAAKYIIKNLADSALVTASPVAATGYPVTNVQTQERTQVFRATSLVSQQLKFSWATGAQRISGIALVGHNLTAAATIMIDQYTTSTFGGTNTNLAAAAAFSYTGLDSRIDLTSDDMLIRRNVARYPTLKTDTQSLIVTIVDTNNPAGFISVGRVIIGECEEFTYGFPEGGEGSDMQDTGTQERAQDASLLSNPGDAYDELALSIKYLPEATDLQKLLYAKEYWGKTKDFWFSKYPGTGDKFEFYGQNAWKVADGLRVNRASIDIANTILVMATT